jgi:uncharacterized protein YukE
MPATVINDPESIHAYRGKIQDAIEKLKTQLSKTEIAVETVSESWKDSNFQQFRDNFNMDKEQIKPLCEVLSNYESNLLYQLEQKLRTYKSSPTHL